MTQNKKANQKRNQFKIQSPTVKEFRENFGWKCKECGFLLGTMSRDGHWLRIGDRAFTVNIYEAPLVVIVCRGCHSIQELENSDIDGLIFEISRHLSDEELESVIAKINAERQRAIEQNEIFDKITKGGEKDAL